LGVDDRCGGFAVSAGGGRGRARAGCCGGG
jgi:hypothetical protein